MRERERAEEKRVSVARGWGGRGAGRARVWEVK